MAATMTEIAREAKVSVALVSRFLNNDSSLRISDDKRNRIHNARVKLGGVQMRHAMKIIRRKLAYKFSIPVNRNFSPEWIQENILGTQEYRSFEQTLNSRDFRVSVNFFDPDNCLEFFKDMAPSQGYCDGFLIGTRVLDREISNWLLANQISHVCTDPEAEQFGVNTVYDHKIVGLQQSVRHLVELGHRRIGYVGRPEYYPLFVLAMTKNGVSVVNGDFCVVAPLTLQDALGTYRDNAQDAFAKWFKHEQSPTAMLCGNDYIAMGVTDVLQERGLTPGKDLSIIGYDNIEQRGEKQSAKPFLTTVDVPFDIIGQRYAERLLDQTLNGQRTIIHEHIPVELLVRETTGPCISTSR